MSLKLTILGCGTSTGVPRIGGIWGACDPENPKNRRRRCSVLVERGGSGGTTRVLVDTSPDLREQLLGAEIGEVDGVLFSHDHADHTHGIDDLRGLAIAMRRRVDVYFDARTGTTLKQRFGYCFETPPGGSYPPILTAHVMGAGTPVRIEGAGGGIQAQPFLQQHGEIQTLGFRFGPIAYSSDVNGLSEEAFAGLQGVDVWIVDALRYVPHPSHFSVEEALAAIARVAPRRAVLTHMHVDLDYETLKRDLPPNIEPAYDGMVIEAAD